MGIDMSHVADIDPAPLTVLAHCLTLDACQGMDAATVRQALHRAGIPPDAAYERWSEVVERGLTLLPRQTTSVPQETTQP